MKKCIFILQIIVLGGILLNNSADAIEYSYDENGNRLTMTDFTGATYYEYDALNRLIFITNPQGETIAYEYDGVGRRTKMTLPNGIVAAYTYDAANRLTDLTYELNGVVIAGFSYTYDNVGNRVTMTDSYGTHTYAYDSLYQLISAAHPNQPAENYSYDDVGNRQGAAYSYNAGNQLLEDESYLYSYDKNGNTIKKMDKTDGSTAKFFWTVNGDLAIIAWYNNNDTAPVSTAKYVYDGLGRRGIKNVDGVITRYVYDQEDILFETDVSGNILARYTHGPGIDEPISVDRNGQTYYYIADGLGSIVKLVDEAGNVVNNYVYDSFGNMVEKTEAVANPYTYTAREYDVESGLYYYRTRYYDARIGRFISEDKINFSTAQYPIQFRPQNCPDISYLLDNPLQQHPYLYAQNNPINFIDPWGTKVPDWDWGTPTFQGYMCTNLVSKGQYDSCSSCCNKQFDLEPGSDDHADCESMCDIGDPNVPLPEGECQL